MPLIFIAPTENNFTNLTYILYIIHGYKLLLFFLHEISALHEICYGTISVAYKLVAFPIAYVSVL